MATRKIPDRGHGDEVQRISGPGRLRILLALSAAAAAAALAACSSSGASPDSSPSSSASSSPAAEAAGSTQATFDGHPLYTFVGDSAPGQARGNNLNLNGGLWHVVHASG